MVEKITSESPLVGDLVKVADDVGLFCGFGVVLEKLSPTQVKVFWFDVSQVLREWNESVEVVSK